MFKRRTKEFRKRSVSRVGDGSSEDNGNVSDASVGTAPVAGTDAPSNPNGAAAAGQGDPLSSTSGSRPKKMRKKIKTKSDKETKPVLSFGHEDEEDNGGGRDSGSAGTGGQGGVFRVKKSKASKVSPGDSLE